MAAIPADVEPYVLEALRVARKRLTEFNRLITESAAPAPEEFDYWSARVLEYEDAIAALLLTLETP